MGGKFKLVFALALYFLMFNFGQINTVEAVPGGNHQNWTKRTSGPVLKKNLTTKNSWGALVKGDPVVIWDKEENKYKSWFSCNKMIRQGVWSNLAICYAYSADGINWTEYEFNPVLALPAEGENWEYVNPSGSGLETPFVIKENGVYKMWHQTYDKEHVVYGNTMSVIGYITSTDGINWGDSKLPGRGKIKVLKGEQKWDSWTVSDPSILVDSDEIDPAKKYKMWYQGIGPDYHPRLGYAYSADGINWTEYENNPVLDISTTGWDSAGVFAPHVIKRKGAYEMWYAGSDKQPDAAGQTAETGYAWSNDGITWHKGGSNPVITLSNQKDQDNDLMENIWASMPAVLVDEDSGLYRMWYAAYASLNYDPWSAVQICYAEMPLPRDIPDHQ